MKSSFHLFISAFSPTPLHLSFVSLCTPWGLCTFSQSLPAHCFHHAVCFSLVHLSLFCSSSAGVRSAFLQAAAEPKRGTWKSQRWMIWHWQEFYQQQYNSVAFEPEALKSIPVLPHTSRQDPGTCGLTQCSPGLPSELGCALRGCDLMLFLH